MMNLSTEANPASFEEAAAEALERAKRTGISQTVVELECTGPVHGGRLTKGERRVLGPWSDTPAQVSLRTEDTCTWRSGVSTWTVRRAAKTANYTDGWRLQQL